MSELQKWFYAKEGQREGPFFSKQFLNLFNTGVINESTSVWKEGMADWEPLSGHIERLRGEAESEVTVSCPTCGKMSSEAEVIQIGSTQLCVHCKDQYAQRIKEGVPGSFNPNQEEYEAIRHEHLKHEASLKSVSLLYFLGGAFMILGGFVSLMNVLMISDELGATATGGMIGGMTIFLLLGILMIFLGKWFRSLNPKLKIPGSILAALGLLQFPIGTLINGYILYLIHSQKGKMVLSAEYKDVIEATPDIKYKTSKVVIVLGILVIGVLVFAMVVAAVGKL